MPWPRKIATAKPHERPKRVVLVVDPDVAVEEIQRLLKNGLRHVKENSGADKGSVEYRKKMEKIVNQAYETMREE